MSIKQTIGLAMLLSVGLMILVADAPTTSEESKFVFSIFFAAFISLAIYLLTN